MCPRDPHEKAMQRALIQYRDPKNYALVREALVKAHREDLIGSGAKCLIRSAPPRPGEKSRDSQTENASRPSKETRCHFGLSQVAACFYFLLYRHIS